MCDNSVGFEKRCYFLLSGLSFSILFRFYELHSTFKKLPTQKQSRQSRVLKLAKNNLIILSLRWFCCLHSHLKSTPNICPLFCRDFVINIVYISSCHLKFVPERNCSESFKEQDLMGSYCSRTE